MVVHVDRKQVKKTECKPEGQKRNAARLRNEPYINLFERRVNEIMSDNNLEEGELKVCNEACGFLTSTATATLVSAFGSSRIDCCNSLLFGSTHDVSSLLQRMQNYAARVTMRLPMSSSITIHLRSLHWLPVKVRSTYKIACLCYHCHSSTAPSYVADTLH